MATVEDVKPSLENETENKDIVWSDVNFSAGSNTILNNCWGEVKSGQLCAVMVCLMFD